mmetsp:Transcript_21471/g.50473  ORF Transcript_21471/g.50473 Transcript_21471/m.50473 type:complete len:98 (-) Transcript_21471:2395-2688(-)
MRHIAIIWRLADWNLRSNDRRKECRASLKPVTNYYLLKTDAKLNQVSQAKDELVYVPTEVENCRRKGGNKILCASSSPLILPMYASLKVRKSVATFR